LVGDDEGFVNTDPFTLLFQKLNGAEIDLNLGDVIDEGHNRFGSALGLIATLMHAVLEVSLHNPQSVTLAINKSP
jgi:hypothetical protein